MSQKTAWNTISIKLKKQKAKLDTVSRGHTHILDNTVLKSKGIGTSLVAQWLRLQASNAGGLGSIPGRGTRSHMRAATKTRCNQINK